MTKSIRTHLGFGLAEAKRCTDSVLEGNEILLAVPDAATALSLADELDALGADAVLENDLPPSLSPSVEITPLE